VRVALIQPERPIYWADVIYQIQEALHGTADVHLVGGVVRDAYRDHPFKDIDLVCAGDGQPIARKIANTLGGAYYPLDKERGVGRAILPEGRLVIDVSAMRGGDLLADLQDRDFTINAMSVLLDSDLTRIYDPLGGIADWHERVLRRCSDQSIANDPIRALRAVRQSLQLGLKIEPETRADLRSYGPELVHTSSERVRDEIFALLDGGKPQGGLAVLHTLGLLQIILPEIAELTSDEWRFKLNFIDKLTILLTVISPRRDDNLAANAEFGTFVYLLDRFRGWVQSHLARSFPDERSYRALLIFCALLHGQYPEAAAERAVSLKLSNDEVRAIAGALDFMRWPLEIHEDGPPDARTVYRYWRQAGDAGIDACLLTIAHYLAERGFQLDTPAWTALLQTIAALFDGYDAAINLVPLVTGDDVMAALGINPGPRVGQILNLLHEAQALGEIQSADEAFDLAADWLSRDQ
jgi:tRNA nucleotidyltransferase/poly(A) polymerase